MVECDSKKIVRLSYLINKLELRKIILTMTMLIITANLMAFRKTKILEHQINNSKITKIEINDDKLGMLEQIKIELGKVSIKKIHSDDNLDFGTLSYKYFINETEVLKLETKIFGMGIMYEVKQAFGVTIVSKLQMQETGYEIIAYYKINCLIDKMDYSKIEDISNEITKEEYNKINKIITDSLKKKESSVIKEIETDINLKIKEIEDIMSEKF